MLTRNLFYAVTYNVVACVASVSVGFGSKERDFWSFAHAENGEREPKMKYGCGGGEGFVGKRFLPFFPSPPPSFTCSIFALQFFAPEPHRNACYAGYNVEAVSPTAKLNEFLNLLTAHLIHN